MARRRGIIQYTGMEKFDLPYVAYSPTVSVFSGSGSVTVSTVDFAEYIQIGDFVHSTFNIDITLSGTDSTTVLEFGLPVGTAWVPPASAGYHCGRGYYYNGSLAFECSMSLYSGFSTVKFYTGNPSDTFVNSARTIFGNYCYRVA